MFYFTCCSFDLGFDTIEVYTNEEKTRTFIALKASPLSRKFLLNITEKVDTVLEDYKLPTFYEVSYICNYNFFIY